VSFPPTLPRWATRGGLLLALGLAVVVLRWTVLAPALVPVRVVRVDRGHVEATVSNSRAGTVKARRRAKLSPAEGGIVVAIPKRRGESVHAGEVVLALDTRIPEARLALARSELAAVRAERIRACLTAERAARERERHRRLAAHGIVAADQLDQVDSAARVAAVTCEAAQASAERAQAAVDLAARQLDQMVLRAPFDGVVAELSIELGEWTTPSPPVIQVPAVIDILDPTSIYVSAPMDEVDAGKLRPGLPGRVAVDSHPGRHFPGRVVRVAPYVLDREEQNRTVEIEIELDDPAVSSSLLPGTSADVEVVLETREAVVRIPTAALLSGDTVLLVDDDRLVERPIAGGLRNWDFTEVQSGLVEGERVVVSLDRAEVRPGARVRVHEDAEP